MGCPVFQWSLYDGDKVTEGDISVATQVTGCILRLIPRIYIDLEELNIYLITASFFQLTDRCVNVLVGSFKETILAECPGMIAANETESKYGSCWFRPMASLPLPSLPSHRLN